MYFNGAASPASHHHPHRYGRRRRRVRAGPVRGGRRDPRPGRPDQRRRVGSTVTTRSCCARVARSVDSIGQIGVDPGTEWGTGLTSTADNTLRRKPAVEAGDTDADRRVRPGRRSGTGSPPTPSTGSVPTRWQPTAVLTCGPAPGHADRRRRDPDGHRDRPRRHDHRRSTSRVSPDPGRRQHHPYGVHAGRAASGGTATAEITVERRRARGHLRGDGHARPTPTAPPRPARSRVQVDRPCSRSARCRADARHRERDDRPVAARAGHRQRQLGHAVRRARRDHPATLARTSAGANQHGFFLQSRLGATDGDPLTSDGIFVFMGSLHQPDRRLRADRRRRGRSCGPGWPSSSTSPS